MKYMLREQKKYIPRLLLHIPSKSVMLDLNCPSAVSTVPSSKALYLSVLRCPQHYQCGASSTKQPRDLRDPARLHSNSTNYFLRIVQRNYISIHAFTRHLAVEDLAHSVNIVYVILSSSPLQSLR
jgi:hypothetical protein